MSLSSARMVPNGVDFFLNYVIATAASNKPLSIRFRATCDDAGILAPGIFIYNEVFEIEDTAVPVNLLVPRKFPSFTIIKGSAYSTTAGGRASISYGGFIE